MPSQVYVIYLTIPFWHQICKQLKVFHLSLPLNNHNNTISIRFLVRFCFPFLDTRALYFALLFVQRIILHCERIYCTLRLLNIGSVAFSLRHMLCTYNSKRRKCKCKRRKWCAQLSDVSVLLWPSSLDVFTIMY